MKAFKPLVWAFMVGLLSVAISSCGSNRKSPDEGGGQVAISGKASAMLVQSIGGGVSTPSAVLPYSGTLTATNLTTPGDSTTIPWSVTIDDATLAVTSITTGIVFPGTYEMTLVVSRGAQTYVGTAAGVEIVDGTNAFDITLHPVIGDTNVDAYVATRLVDLRFSYPPTELASLTSPYMGILVDGGGEQVFELDPATGLSEYMFLNLPPGDHTLELRVYDERGQRGRSIPAQQAQNLQPGIPVSMDLVPLAGETVVTIDETTGDATFNFAIPTEVVDEAGGVDNLRTVLSVVGPANPTGHEVELALTDAVTNYVASTTLPGFQFGAVTISLAFGDRNGTPDAADDEPLGNCTVPSVTLSTPGTTVACAITLRRRSVIAGNLLALVGVNVYDQAGFAVPNAVVTANGEIVGVTGSGAFGTPGYLKFYHVAQSDVVIQAVSAELFKTGGAVVTLAPLSVNNVTLVLNEAYVNTLTNILPSADDTEFEIALPFTFFHFGVPYAAVGVATNGYLTFDRLDGADNASNYVPGLIPQPGGVDNMIAAAWTDLNPNQGGAISWEVVGTAPNRSFVVQYDLLPWYGSGSTPRVTSQVILHENTSISEVHTLRQAAYGGAGVTANTYTQGVEDASGTIAAYIAGRNNADYELVRDGVQFTTAAGSASAVSIPFAPYEP